MRPLNSRFAASVSETRNPRTISSTWIAVVAGTSPRPRSAAIRLTAGRPLRKSMRTVESKTWSTSARAAGVGPALLAHPASRVVVPFMTDVVDHSSRCFDVGPTHLLPNGLFDGGPYESATPARSRKLIEAADEAIIQLYVHSHVLSMTHGGDAFWRTRCEAVTGVRSHALAQPGEVRAVLS